MRSDDVSSWSDERLRTYSVGSRVPPSHGWLRGLTGTFLIVCAPFVVWLPLRRAAEVSAIWEVVAWCVFASLTTFASLSWRYWNRIEREETLVRFECERRGLER